MSKLPFGIRTLENPKQQLKINNQVYVMNKIDKSQLTTIKDQLKQLPPSGYQFPKNIDQQKQLIEDEYQLDYETQFQEALPPSNQLNNISIDSTAGEPPNKYIQFLPQKQYKVGMKNITVDLSPHSRDLLKNHLKFQRLMKYLTSKRLPMTEEKKVKS